jgi:hypothetical protein
MLFNYGKNNLKTSGTKISVVSTNSSSNVTMSMSGSSRCNGYSMRSSMHSKSNPKTRCGACGNSNL